MKNSKKVNKWKTKGSRCILSVHLPRNFLYKYGSVASRISYQHLSTSVNMYQHTIYMQQHTATLAMFNCLEIFLKKIRAYIYRGLNQHMSTLINMHQHSINIWQQSQLQLPTFVITSCYLSATSTQSTQGNIINMHQQSSQKKSTIF